MGLFSKIFKTDKNRTFGNSLRLLNGYQAIFTSYNGELYNSNEVRSCIDTIARNVAKLNPKHLRGNDNYEELNKRIWRLLSEQPNEMDNAYTFYYKIATERFLRNNAFVYIQRDEKERVTGLYPIRSGQYQLMEYQNNIYVQFRFSTGKIYTASLKDDVIHLKRFATSDDVTGADMTPIVKVMSIKHIMNEGLINAIKTTQSIRGFLKTTKAMLKPEDIKKTRDDFVNDFINSRDGSGIAGLDATTDFKPVSLDPQTASDSQIQEINDEIYNYFGLNKEIIQSSYDENKWNAFYENVIEPVALEMGNEFTNKLFTIDERYRGNRIVFESNRLQYASVTSKINVAKAMQNYMTINEIREIFNLAPVENGDRILQSLNNIDSSVANQYQIGESEDKDDE